MGLHYSPKISSNGLVLAYDVSDNVNCYKGEPTTNYYNDFAPWVANSGYNIDISGQISVPIPESKTWMFVKTGEDSQWNGWEGTYGVFNGSSGDYWTISYWYKTTNNISNLSTLNFYVGDWSRPYNTTSITQNNTLIADGKWHYNYSTIQFNESYSGAIIVDGPSWNYSTSSGIMYINGLQWEKKSHPTNYVSGNRSTTNSLLDISGKNNTLNLNNISFDSNKKIYFDGTNDCINITDNNGSLGLTSVLTIEAIVKPNNVSSNGNIFSCNYNSGYRMRINTDNKAWIYFNGNTINGGYCPLNEYSHIVGTGDSSGLKLYVNGVLVSYNSTPLNSQIGGSIYVGSSTGSHEFFNGYIDIVRVYNRALNSYEVINNFSNFKLKFDI